MRSLLAGTVVGIFLGIGLLAWAGPDVATLSGVRFYLQEFGETVQSGAFDPFDFWDHAPTSVGFPAPGRLEIDWGQETEECRFETLGSDPAYSLVLECGGQQRQAQWKWVAEGRVVTDLLGEEAQAMVLLESSFDELVAAHERDFAEKSLPSLAGLYQDSSGVHLNIGADGRASLGGAQFDLRILECLNLSPTPGTEEAPARVACVLFDGGTAGGTVFAAMPTDGGHVLVEGRIPDDELYPDGRPFEPAPAGKQYQLQAR